MSSGELVKWAAWLNIEPHGERRADLRAANVAFQMCRYQSGEKVKFSDFILDFNGPKENTPEKNEAIAIGLIDYFKALIKSGNPIVKAKRPENADQRSGSDTSS